MTLPPPAGGGPVHTIGKLSEQGNADADGVSTP